MIKKSSVVSLFPAFGLIAGSLAGDVIGLLTGRIALFAAIGSGIGLVAGAVLYSKKIKDTDVPGDTEIIEPSELEEIESVAADLAEGSTAIETGEIETIEVNNTENEDTVLKSEDAEDAESEVVSHVSDTESGEVKETI